MSEVFDTLRKRYRDLIDRSVEGAGGEAFLGQARSFLSDTRQAGAVVPDTGERAQLRAYARFLAARLAEAGEDIPPIDLLPLDRERWPAPMSDGARTGTMPWWAWAVTGAAALVVIAGLIAVAGFSMGAFPAAVTPTSAPPSPTLVPPTSTFTPTPVPPTSTPTPVPSPTPTSTPVPPDPAFGNFVVALGVEDPSTPFLTGEVFDWNAKAVYVLFDYEGMQNGPEWSVVWMRNGEEVEREEGPWDVERYGAEGTRWVVTRAPVVGDVLFGGAYTVTLAIEGDVAGEATFRIQYYATPTP